MGQRVDALQRKLGTAWKATTEARSAYVEAEGVLTEVEAREGRESDRTGRTREDR